MIKKPNILLITAGQIFDLQRNSMELRNVAAHPAYAERIQFWRKNVLEPYFIVE